MGGSSRHRRTGWRREIAAALALVALLFQSLLPMAHAAAMARATEPGSIVLCTAEGPKSFVLDPAGDLRPAPADRAARMPPACPGCLGAPVPLALLPLQPAFGPADRPAEPPVLIAPSLTPDSPRADPAQPRAPPPASV